MFNILRSGPLKLILLLTLALTPVSSAGCFGSPLIDIIIENQTDQVLTIYYTTGGTPLGDIAPSGQIVIRRGMNIGKYPISARNAKGEVVFSETYTRMPNDKYHLIETNLKHEGVVKVYKAIIPPLTTTPESSGK